MRHFFSSIFCDLRRHNHSSLIAFPLFALLVSSCGKMPLAPSSGGASTGRVEIHSCIIKNGLAKSLATLATTCDSLIVEVSGTDITTLRFSKPFDLARPVHSDTLAGIPTGTDRAIKVYTIDRSGTVVHTDTVDHRGLKIDPSAAAQLNVTLVPAMGSIYVQLENIPTRVDSVFAKFTADDKRVWSAQAKRSTKLFMSLDKIPSKTHGMLTVAALDSAKDTLYVASKELTFDASAMGNIALDFSSTPGQFAFDLAVVLPGVTSASGNMGQPEPSAVESGELVVTEIMYAANDSEYIEVFNPKDTDRVYDTLCLDIDGTYRLFTNITIPAQRAFVFGRRLLPWCDVAHPVTTALDLSSTGNWITLRTKKGQVIDRVAFTGGTNALEVAGGFGKAGDRSGLRHNRCIDEQFRPQLACGNVAHCGNLKPVRDAQKQVKKKGRPHKRAAPLRRKPLPEGT